MLRTSSIAVAITLALQVAPAAAQTSRAETQSQAMVVVADGCLLTAPSATVGDWNSVGGENAFAIAAGTFGAQVLGDLASAGANILASALEEASRERAFVYSGRASFDFFQFGREAGEASGGTETTALARPRALAAISPSAGGQCLIVAVPDSVAMAQAAEMGATLPALTAAQQSLLMTLLLRPEGAAQWAALGLPAQPALYIEAEIQSRPDGFRLRPVLVWRRAPLPRTQRNGLPTELHVTFTTPALATDTAPFGTPFAVGRISLPLAVPGERQIQLASTLRPYASEVLPLRPVAGSPASSLAALTAAEAAVVSNQREIDVALRTEARARGLAAVAGAKPEVIAAWRLAQDQLADAQAARPALVARAGVLADEAATARIGSTNVQARVVMIRDANQFGLALAKAIRDRAPAVGAAITADLVPQTRAQAWTTADTNYVTTMSTVQAKTDALARAVAAGDANLVLTARLELQNAQAAANAAAAASNRALPFPDVI